MANTLMSIQIIPKTPNGEDVIPYIDEAIKVIQASGLSYVVNPLDTTIEGDMPELLQLIEEMNKKMMSEGVVSVISQVKFYHAADASMAELVKKYR